MSHLLLNCMKKSSFRFGDFIMIKAEDSAKPFIAYVNDTRTCRISDDDYVDVLWIYRKDDVNKPELRRLEKKTSLLSSDREIFLSLHQDRAPVQSVFQSVRVRIEFSEERRGSQPFNVEGLQSGELLCRFLYDVWNQKLSALKREDLPPPPSSNQNSLDRKAGSHPLVKDPKLPKRREGEAHPSGHAAELGSKEVLTGTHSRVLLAKLHD